MIKILHVLNSAKVGGTEAWVKDFCASSETSLIINEVFFIRKKGLLLSKFGAESKAHRVEMIPLLGRVFRIARLLRETLRSRPDQVWFHSDESRLYASFFRSRSRLFVAVCHSQWGLDKCERHLSRWKPLQRWDRTVVVGASLVDSKIFGKIAENRTSRPPLVIIPPPQVDALVLAKEKDPLVFGYGARMVPGKGHHLLLAAFQIVLRNYPGAELLLAGDGNLRSELVDLIDSLGVKENVRLLGETQGQGGLLKEVGIYLLPSESEGLSRSGLEAAIHGIPLALYDLDAYRPFAKKGKNCVAFSTYSPDAMAQSIQQILEKFADFSDNARSVADELHSELVATFDESLKQVRTWRRIPPTNSLYN